MKNMTMQRNVWFARLGIPADVRHLFDNKTTLVKTTGTGDKRKAEAITQTIVGQWRQDIGQARAGLTMTRDRKLVRLAESHREAVQSGDIDRALGLILRDLPLMADTPADRLWALFRDNHGDISKVLASLPGAVTVETVTTAKTDFLYHFDQWKRETEITGKSLANAVLACERFSNASIEPVETLSRKHVQQFIVGLREAGLANGTIRNYLSGIRGYWEWMLAHEYVLGANPFAGHRQKKAPKSDRTGFKPRDVVRLVTHAEGDKPLQNLIRIAMYTGARRESICSLVVSEIENVDGIECFHFDDKTDAGNRLVPVHSKLRPLIADMIKSSDKDGFLFHNMIPNKWGNRSDAIGKRFSNAKTKMGFGKELTFHSIRHTVSNLFLNGKVEEFIAADILGHEKPTITYGLYGGISEVKLKQEALEKAIIYPEA